MGRFSGKFVAAAKEAGKLLATSLYSTYYEIDYAVVDRLTEAQTPANTAWLRRHKSEAGGPFAALCRTRAGATSSTWNIAVNGMIIEQQQILTTQNLAVLVSRLGLNEELSDHFPHLARHCLDWICARLQRNAPSWHSLLIMLKNTAYAWRQMVFFLSLLPKSEVDEFLSWADEYLTQQPVEFQGRFRPAVEGLRRAAGGGSPEDGNLARRFLGWTNGRHWLLGPKPPA
jgi:hypothetical protein